MKVNPTISTTLRELVDESHKIAKEKGFWDQSRNIGELLMLIVSEASEALEADRKNRRTINKVIDTAQAFEENVKNTFEDEIADILIRVFDLCGGLGIDIDWHVQAKLEYNKSRERLHGKLY